MKITYHLSSGQRKELLVRGRPITLLLPVPPIEIDDPVDWARSVLPADLRPLVRSAAEEEVLVSPHSMRARRAENLTELLGAIVGESVRAWLVTMIVVRVELSPAEPRGKALPAQWPMDVVVDGRPLTRRQEARV